MLEDALRQVVMKSGDLKKPLRYAREPSLPLPTAQGEREVPLGTIYLAPHDWCDRLAPLPQCFHLPLSSALLLPSPLSIHSAG